MAVENRSSISIGDSMRVAAELADRAKTFGSTIEPTIATHPGGIVSVTVLSDQPIGVREVYAWNQAVNGAAWEITPITVDTSHGRTLYRHTTVEYNGLRLMVQFVQPAMEVAA